ncbi:MAG: hypothetical protein KF795_18695 [Labilithrix sp.]|nr:hypothetical protein [Labilithrix sp.]
MRASIGLGLVSILGLVACAAAGGDTAANVHEDPAPGGEVGSSTDSTDTAPPPEAPPEPAKPTEEPPRPLVRGIAINEVAMFQAVKVPVMKAGAAVDASSRKAPVVAKRTGMLRVYVAPGAGWKPRDVTAELRLVAGDGHKLPVVRDTKMILADSKEEDPTSTFNLEIPGESLPAGVTYQVALTAPDGEDPTQAHESDSRYPKDGSFESLGAETSGKLRVVLVPIKYDADGSGRVPAVGPTELELYRKTMMRLYPTSDVEVKARAPYSWTTQISSNGGGFSQVLRAVTQIRQEDQVEKDVYYYGLLTPRDSMSAYCQGGCVTGLSTVVDNPTAAGMRASVGIGFANTESANTMAHEIGHAHGRAHAPCGGPQGVDPRYPYQGGSIGTWGYDIFSKALISPAKGRDMMGYCRNEWVSDYTYNALFQRVAAISVEKKVANPMSSPPSAAVKQAARYRVATVGDAGELAWDGDIDFASEDELDGADVRQATFYAESGAEVTSRAAKFFAFDHLPGGFVFVPKDAALEAARWKAIAVEGFAKKLAR